MEQTTETRREFVKKAAYVAPAILTLKAAPSYAKSGSEKPDKGPKGGKEDRDDRKSSMNAVPPLTDVPHAPPGPTA